MTDVTHQHERKPYDWIIRRRAVLVTHRTEFTVILGGRAVEEGIDDVDGSDLRPIKVEDRQGQPNEQEVPSDFDPVTIECM